MIALGTRVAFTEVAYIVRRGPDSRDVLWGTPARGNFTTVDMTEWPDDVPVDVARFLGSTEKTNKNVIALPSQGSGVVIGLERKFAGKSVAPQSGGYDSDWEPGWFEPKGAPIDLYVVKSELRGKAFYVPPESLTVLS